MKKDNLADLPVFVSYGISKVHYDGGDYSHIDVVNVHKVEEVEGQEIRCLRAPLATDGYAMIGLAVVLEDDSVWKRHP